MEKQMELLGPKIADEIKRRELELRPLRVHIALLSKLGDDITVEQLCLDALEEELERWRDLQRRCDAHINDLSFRKRVAMRTSDDARSVG